MGKGGESAAAQPAKSSAIQKFLLAVRNSGLTSMVHETEHQAPEGTKSHHVAAVKLALQDINARRNEYWFPVPSGLTCLLEEERDLPMLATFSNITLLVGGSAVALFTFSEPGTAAAHFFGVLYVVWAWVFWGARFILGLHYAEHRRLFSRKLGVVGYLLNKFPSFVLCALWGIPPGFYNLHHVCMHHAENNIFPRDLSSTMPYNRSKFTHFLVYWLNYLVNTTWYLPVYALYRKRWEQFVQYFVGLGLYLAAGYLGWQIHHTATTYVLIVPFFMASFFLMLGNFSQHIFINHHDVRSNYGLTYNLLGSKLNQTTFNDGYHIVHHENSRCHWSEMPAAFIKNIDKYEAEDALLFRQLTYEEVSFYVFGGKFDELASYVVQLQPKPRAHAEVVALLKDRLKACELSVPEKKKTL